MNLDEGLFHQQKGNLNQAWHKYLDAILEGCQELRDQPSFKGIQKTREALLRAEEILKILAKEPQVDSMDSRDSKVDSKLNHLVIPISPLVKQLQKYQKLEQEAQVNYNEILQSKVADLKLTRELLQEVEVNSIMCQKIRNQIDSVKSVLLYEWDPPTFALHVSSLTKSLFAQISPNDVVIPSLDRISLPLLRFLAFQEYLYNSLSNLCIADGREIGTKLADFMINTAYSLVFTQHDIATFCTFLTIIDNLGLGNFASQQQKIMLGKLSEMTGDSSLDIMLEIAEDMIGAHPVTSVSTSIVPNLAVLIQGSIKLYSFSPIGDKNAAKIESMVKVVGKCHFPGVLADMQDLHLQDTLLHWIVTRVYQSKYERSFWKQICTEIPISVLVQKPSKPEVELVQEIVEEKVKEDAPAAPETVDPAEEMIRRLNALRGK